MLIGRLDAQGNMFEPVVEETQGINCYELRNMEGEKVNCVVKWNIYTQWINCCLKNLRTLNLEGTFPVIEKI